MTVNLLESPLALAFVALVGLVMGSFLNCLAWRWVHGESVVHGRSHCACCGHELGPLDLVPVLSWVLSRGRCRYCDERISARYPATELLCALIYVSIAGTYGATVETLELIAFASVLLVLSLIDLDTYIIPNETIIACIVIRAAYLLYLVASGQPNATSVVVESLIGAVAIGIPLLALVLIMDRVLGRESMGGGDLKLFAVAGLYFGWQRCMVLILIACVVGIVFGLVGPRPEDPGREVPTPKNQETGDRGEGVGYKAEGDRSRRASQPFPFGPSIALACWITMLFGAQILNWYLSLF